MLLVRRWVRLSTQSKSVEIIGEKRHGTCGDEVPFFFSFFFAQASVKHCAFQCPPRHPHPWGGDGFTHRDRGLPSSVPPLLSPKADNDGIGKQETKAGFRLCGVETHIRLWLRLFCSTATKKTCFSHIERHRCRESSPCLLYTSPSPRD